MVTRFVTDGRTDGRTDGYHSYSPPLGRRGTKRVVEGLVHRFEEVADRLGWSKNNKPDELLLRWAAGDFVFGQLSKSTHGSNKALTRELKTRFRVIENP